MTSGRRLAAFGLLGLAVAGCATPGAGGTGSAQVVLPAHRQIQYVSADIRALRVTLTHQISGQTYVKSFPGTALLPDPAGSRLGFVADNLPPGSYQARLEAFLDVAETVRVGSVDSPPFAIAAYAITPVTLSSLTLMATPLGDWRMTVGLNLKGGYKVKDFVSALSTPAGSALPGPAGTSLSSGYRFTWGNVPAFPGGVSTSSITVRAANSKGNEITKTQVATASLIADTTLDSSLNFVFP